MQEIKSMFKHKHKSGTYQKGDVQQQTLLYNQLSNSFLIGRKPTLNFRNQRP